MALTSSQPRLPWESHGLSGAQLGILMPAHGDTLTDDNVSCRSITLTAQQLQDKETRKSLLALRNAYSFVRANQPQLARQALSSLPTQARAELNDTDKRMLLKVAVAAEASADEVKTAFDAVATPDNLPYWESLLEDLFARDNGQLERIMAVRDELRSLSNSSSVGSIPGFERLLLRFKLQFFGYLGRSSEAREEFDALASELQSSPLLDSLTKSWVRTCISLASKAEQSSEGLSTQAKEQEHLLMTLSEKTSALRERESEIERLQKELLELRSETIPWQEATELIARQEELENSLARVSENLDQLRAEREQAEQALAQAHHAYQEINQRLEVAQDVLWVAQRTNEESARLLASVLSYFNRGAVCESFSNLPHFQHEARSTFSAWRLLSEVEAGRRDEELTAFVGPLTQFRNVLEALLNRALIHPFEKTTHWMDWSRDIRSPLQRALRFQESLGIGQIRKLLFSYPADELDAAFQKFSQDSKRFEACLSSEFRVALDDLLALRLNAVAHDEAEARAHWRQLFALVKRTMYGELDPSRYSLVRVLIEVVEW